MQSLFTPSKVKSASLIAVVSAGVALVCASVANAETDFSNPTVAMSNQALVASGTCIAKYAASLDDSTKPAAEIAQKVARRCSKEISKSAGLASYIVGKPEEYQKNLKYTQENLTTGAVLRFRAAATRQHSV